MPKNFSVYIIEIEKGIWTTPWPQEITWDNPELDKIICKTKSKREAGAFFTKIEAIEYLDRKNVRYNENNEYPKIHEIKRK